MSSEGADGHDLADGVAALGAAVDHVVDCYSTSEGLDVGSGTPPL